jgi:hypothetical protein
VQARRSEQADKGLVSDFLDCEPCQQNFTLLDRRCLGCGWIPESDRLSGDRPFPESDVCPGYLVRQPEVVEAARARSWTSRGGLVPVYGSVQLPRAALDAIDTLEGSVQDVEAKFVRERRQKSEAG